MDKSVKTQSPVKKEVSQEETSNKIRQVDVDSQEEMKNVEDIFNSVDENEEEEKMENLRPLLASVEEEDNEKQP